MRSCPPAQGLRGDRAQEGAKGMAAAARPEGGWVPCQESSPIPGLLWSLLGTAE